MVRIAWLVFIRASSQRLPNKCYKSILGKNIFQHISDRARINNIQSRDLFLCTSDRIENKRIIRQANYNNHSLLLGSENEPIQRITKNWDFLGEYDYLVRVCGDSPFYPFGTAINSIITYNSSMPFAIVNTRLRNFPSGYSIEVFCKNQLRSLLEKYPLLTKLEHMSEIFDDPSSLNLPVIDIKSKKEINFFIHPSYTVDVSRDLEHIELSLECGLDVFYDERLRNIELN